MSRYSKRKKRLKASLRRHEEELSYEEFIDLAASLGKQKKEKELFLLLKNNPDHRHRYFAENIRPGLEKKLGMKLALQEATKEGLSIYKMTKNVDE